MPTEELADFSSPWAQALIQDPAWTPVLTFSRVSPAAPSTENALLARSLGRPDCVRAVQSFHHFPCPPPSRPPTAPASYVHHETRMLFSLGSGLDGHSGFTHGGLIGTLIDEAMGQCVATVFGRTIVTVEINVQFRKMLPTPSIVLCRAWIEEEPAGRKVWVRAAVEDGVGGVFATGGGLFIRTRPKI